MLLQASCYSFPEKTFSEPTARSILSPRYLDRPFYLVLLLLNPNVELKRAQPPAVTTPK